MLSPLLPLSRIVFSGITAELLPEGGGKTAGVAETHQICDLCHGVLAAFDERQAFGRTVFLEILRHRLSCHFPEETAADLAGQMHLLTKLFERNHGF